MLKSRSTTRRVLPWLLLLLAALLLLKLIGLLTPLQSLVSSAMQPLTTPFYGAGSRVARVFHNSSDLAVIEQENEKLRDENTNLKLRLAGLEEAAQENATLRQLLDYFETDAASLPRVIARIVSRDPANPSILTLNVGQRDGVQVQNAVVVKEGVLVAKIVEVHARTSRALILTDANISIAATISGGAPSSKLVRGERGLSLILDQVPQQEIISKGQLVTTSGLEASIPRGLLIGEIEEVISEKNDLFQTAVLRPLVSFDSLTVVAVIVTGPAGL
ncbi:MAG: rod shape-determining protein MreC [Parcubacteria group bacterium]|nr:rod shape-determining protein MreC [Parcubacteria group bacterium]